MGEALARFLAVRAAVVPAVCFVIGIALPAADPWTWALAALAVALAGALVDRRGLPGGLLLLFLAFGLAGSALAGVRLAAGALPDFTPGEPCVVEGTVEGSPSRPELAVDGSGSPERIANAHFRAALHGAPPTLLPGMRVRVLARLFRSRPPMNPGEPDAVARDRDRAVDVHAVLRPDAVLVLEPAPVWQRWAAGFRARFAQLAAAAIDDDAGRALVVALAVGDRGAIPPELNERFNASGLAHILSVSGLHIAVVAFGLLAVLRALFLRWTWLALRVDVRRLAGVAALPAIWLYVALTGGEVPAVRSGIMATALVVARLVRREPEPFTTLAWAAVACLAWDPAELHDVSFQLSFVAVLGLMTLVAPLRALVPIARPSPRTRGWRRRAEKLRELVVSGGCTSLAASLATAPLVAATFHRESVIAILANLIALPIASALTAAAALAAATSPCAGVAMGLLKLAGVLAVLLDAVADHLGALELAQVRVAAPSLSTTLVFYAGLVAFAVAGVDRRMLAVAGASAAALLGLGAWRTAQPRLDGELSVTFLAVGQGDSTFIRFPGGATLLVDGGGEVGSHFDPGAQILAPFLWDQGVRRLDVVALSHPHPDHALGLIGLGPLVPARELWEAADHEPGGLLAALERVNAGARVRRLARGDAVPAMGGARIDVLGPPRDAHFEKVNDQSLVLKITFGDVAILLPGDVEADAEAALLDHPEDLAATILKAPHHGSKTSSSDAFVDAVHPREVVFCVGLGNRFHFPAPTIDRRYEDAHCERFRTDRDGAITFHTDGHTVRVERFAAANSR